MESNSIIAKKCKNGTELHNCKNLQKWNAGFTQANLQSQ
jgi:hypothetical protein